MICTPAPARSRSRVCRPHHRDEGGRGRGRRRDRRHRRRPARRAVLGHDAGGRRPDGRSDMSDRQPPPRFRAPSPADLDRVRRLRRLLHPGRDRVRHLSGPAGARREQPRAVHRPGRASRFLARAEHRGVDAGDAQHRGRRRHVRLACSPFRWRCSPHATRPPNGLVRIAARFFISRRAHDPGPDLGADLSSSPSASGRSRASSPSIMDTIGFAARFYSERFEECPEGSLRGADRDRGRGRLIGDLRRDPAGRASPR